LKQLSSCPFWMCEIFAIQVIPRKLVTIDIGKSRMSVTLSCVCNSNFLQIPLDYVSRFFRHDNNPLDPRYRNGDFMFFKHFSLIAHTLLLSILCNINISVSVKRRVFFAPVRRRLMIFTTVFETHEYIIIYRLKLRLTPNFQTPLIAHTRYRDVRKGGGGYLVSSLRTA